MFQPHRYSRTSQLLREFGVALSAADEVVLTDIYAAGEPPIPGVTLEALAAAVRACDPRWRARRAGARRPARGGGADGAPGDLVITLGAGSIGGTGERILEAIRHRRTQPARDGGNAMRVKAAAEKNFRRTGARQAGAAPPARMPFSAGAWSA